MCGVFGIENNDKAASAVFTGLLNLQHRGQEAAGTAVYNCSSKTLRGCVGAGNVLNVFNNNAAATAISGNCAIGHVRYATSGKSSLQNAQPFIFNTKSGFIALAHNGNIYNDKQIAARLQKSGAIFAHTSDSEHIMHLVEREKGSLIEALPKALAKINGAYALIFIQDGVMTGVRDPYGIRPLVLGKLGKSYILASESVAIEMSGGEVLRDIAPGEIIAIEKGKIKKSFIFERKKNYAPCIFEQIYFASPASKVCGKTVAKARMEMGKLLARQMKDIKADVVMPVPDSGVFAALGFAKEAKIPFDMGLVRNHYMGRSFITPDQKVRENIVRIKLLPIKEKIKGKRIILIDDSLVRGTTSGKIMRLMKSCGAKEIHFALSAPPVISPCFYGIDTPTKKELIAHNMTTAQIAKFIGASNVNFITLPNLIKAAQGTKCKTFCAACFSGKYPTGIKI
ncbi:MAG: amidophosphoribosyltransferase [Elusimicrobiota bacterium]|jgi:amidophosphoribosyltransferase|nr:amidophosphoribosyltransferase [Elusimicrobiota bacterium]